MSENQNQVDQKLINTAEQNKSFGKFSKIAGIIAVVFFSSYLLIQTNLTIMSWLEGYPLSMLDKWTSEMFVFLFAGLLNEGTVAFLTISFSLTYSILCVIFACKVITFSRRKLEDANAKINSMIAYAIIFGIWIIVPISILIEAAIPIFILAIALILLIVAFMVVDIVKVRKEYGMEKQQMQNIAGIDNVEEELNKLEELKKSKKITKEEYDVLRKKLLS